MELTGGDGNGLSNVLRLNSSFWRTNALSPSRNQRTHVPRTTTATLTHPEAAHRGNVPRPGARCTTHVAQSAETATAVRPSQNLRANLPYGSPTMRHASRTTKW